MQSDSKRGARDTGGSVRSENRSGTGDGKRFRFDPCLKGLLRLVRSCSVSAKSLKGRSPGSDVGKGLSVEGMWRTDIPLTIRHATRKRTLAFVLVVMIHVGFFWVLNSGLGAKMVQIVTGPVETEIIEEPQDEENEPPPPPPDIEHPPPYVPPPEVSIDMPAAQPPTTAISGVTNEQPTAPPPIKAAGTASVKTPPSTTGKGARITQPEYPPSSRRAGEEGTVTLQVYVLETGSAGDVKVPKSSGFPKLDEAAVKEVQRTWRFVPGKEDGKPDRHVAHVRRHLPPDRMTPTTSAARRPTLNRPPRQQNAQRIRSMEPETTVPTTPTD